MKKILCLNYAIVCLTYSLILQDMNTLAFILIALADIILLGLAKRISYLKLMFLSTVCFGFVSFIYLNTNISWFFTGWLKIMAMICLNSAIVYQVLTTYKNKVILDFVVIIFVSFAFLMSLIFALPNSWYSIFTKSSLFAVVAIVYLPYLLPEVLCIVIRLKKNQSIFAKSLLTKLR